MSNFEAQPIIAGKLTSLRPLVNDDFEALYRAAADPELWTQHFDPNRYRKSAFQIFFDRAIESKSALTILDQATGEVVGTSRYDRFSSVNDEVEIGYTFLLRRLWGSSYNREIKNLMLDHAFKYVSNVLFYVYENNFRSQRAVEKLGAEKIELFHGPHHRSFKYRILRDNWLNQAK